jgi:hypothetical protein
MIVTLRNDFHNTEAHLRVRALPADLSAGQVRRAQRRLCGIAGCSCSNSIGTRGPQSVSVYERRQGVWAIDAP